jgi:hypothetical protein
VRRGSKQEYQDTETRPVSIQSTTGMEMSNDDEEQKNGNALHESCMLAHADLRVASH